MPPVRPAPRHAGLRGSGGRGSPRRGRTSVAVGSLLGVGGSVVSTAGGFALVLVATRLLGASGSGGLFVAVAISTVLANVCKLGTDTSLVRFVSQAVTQRRTHDIWPLTRMALLASLAASVAVAVVLFVFSDRLASIVYSSTSAQPGPSLLRWVAVFLPLGTLTLVLLSVTRGFGRVTGFVSVEQILKPALRPLLAVVVCVGGASVERVTVAWLVPIIPGFLLAGWWTSRALLGAREAPAGDATSDPVVPAGDGHVGAREFWSFAAPRALGGTLEILAPWVGVILLSATASSRDAGVFTAAARVVTAGTMVLVAMRLALGPHLSAAYGQADRGTVSRLHQHSTIWSVLISFPFFLTVAVFPEATMSAFGSDFPAGAGALTILVAANLVNVGVGNVQSIVLMAGRSRWNLGNTAAALVVQVVVGLALIPALGLIGAAVGLALGVLCNNLLSLRQATRGLGVEVWSRAVLAAIALTSIVCLCLGLAARLAFGHSVGVLVLTAIAEALVLLAVVVARPRLFDLAEGWRTLTRDLGSAAPAAR